MAATTFLEIPMTFLLHYLTGSMSDDHCVKELTEPSGTISSKMRLSRRGAIYKKLRRGETSPSAPLRVALSTPLLIVSSPSGLRSQKCGRICEWISAGTDNDFIRPTAVDSHPLRNLRNERHSFFY